MRFGRMMRLWARAVAAKLKVQGSNPTVKVPEPASVSACKPTFVPFNSQNHLEAYCARLSEIITLSHSSTHNPFNYAGVLRLSEKERGVLSDRVTLKISDDKDQIWKRVQNKESGQKRSHETLRERLSHGRVQIKDNLRKKREQLEERLGLSESDMRVQLEKRRQRLREALQKRRDIFNESEQMIRDRGRVFLKDLSDTKNLMKDKIGQVVEKENIYTIPNLLCVTRIAFSPYLGYLIVTEQFTFALGFMTVAGISDWLDGWIARNYASQASKIGSFLDPMADKVLIGTLFLTLTYVNLLPVALTALVVARDVTLVLAGFVIRYNSLPPPRTLARYFDATHATAQLAPTLISKVNTGVQLVLVAATLAAPVFGYVGHPALEALCYVTAGTTIFAAASYITKKDTYKYISKK